MTPPVGASRAVSVARQADAIPDSVETHLDLWWPMDEGSGSSFEDALTNESVSLVGSWQDDSKYYGGTAISQDGVDDSWTTDNEISGIHSGDVTVVGWTDGAGSASFYYAFMVSSSGNASSLGSPSWALRALDDGTRWNLRTEDSSGSATGSDIITNGPDITNGDLFFAINASISDGSISVGLELHDGGGLIDSGTATSSIASTSSSAYFQGFEGSFEGRQDAYGIATSEQLSSGAIAEIRDDTKLER